MIIFQLFPANFPYQNAECKIKWNKFRSNTRNTSEKQSEQQRLLKKTEPNERVNIVYKLSIVAGGDDGEYTYVSSFSYVCCSVLSVLLYNGGVVQAQYSDGRVYISIQHIQQGEGEWNGLILIITFLFFKKIFPILIIILVQLCMLYDTWDTSQRAYNSKLSLIVF